MTNLFKDRQLQQRTLIFIRWLAVGGQLAAILIVAFVFGYYLPLAWCLATVGALALVNIIANIRRSRPFVSDQVAAIYLSFDMIQLAFLLYLTGGINNPFAMLMLSPITVSATILSNKVTAFLVFLGLSLVTVLSFIHLNLPIGEEITLLPWIYSWGLFTALCLSLVFIAVYLTIISADSNRLSKALREMQKLLDQQRRLSALGAQAAAAAHALSTPLGTISIISQELTHEKTFSLTIQEDIRLLHTETRRCQEILASLGKKPGQQSAEIEHTLLNDPFTQLPINAILELAAEPYLRSDIKWSVENKLSSAHMLLLLPKPEILQGLGNLLQNAFQFARTQVKVVISENQQQYIIKIQDDGLGFSVDILDRLGEPYISTGAWRRKQTYGGQNMGLGVFIAQSSLASLGVKLFFSNHKAGGAEVKIVWPKPKKSGI